MSAPSKTSGKNIRAVARKILETDGLNNLSMQAVADAVGVKPPSLYKHFANRAGLLQAVTEDALQDLARAIDKVIQSDSARDDLQRMAIAYRTFAKRNPESYQLMFSGGAPNNEADLNSRLASVASLMKILNQCVEAKHTLAAARTLVAFLHGFVCMEMAGLFRLGGDINEAFHFGLTTLLDALLLNQIKS
jgi:AcrR family transcriptional regulator